MGQVDSDEDSKRGDDFPEMESEERPKPCFVQFWQEQSSSFEEDLRDGKRKHPTERRGVKRTAREIEERCSSPTEKVLVYLLNHGSAEDMSAIKGLTPDDIKEVKQSLPPLPVECFQHFPPAPWELISLPVDD
eukprot:symbB.v1.2.006136.t1/scaffold365.1/size219215/11